MGAGAGIALKSLQWFVRGVQFLCSALILAIFSYFLATLHNHDLNIDTWIRAVEGISGAATLYSAIGLLLLCCLAGFTITSFIAICLDVAFCAAFIYVASANKGGAGSCSGYVNTPFGSGDATTGVVDSGQPGFTALPSLKTACKLETACFAVSIILIFFFVLSALLELALGRHHQKEKRFGPGPANDYTSGYPKKRGFAGLFSRRKRGTGVSGNPNALPEHAHPNDVRASVATEQTRVGTATTEPAYPKHGEAGYKTSGHWHTAPGQQTGVSTGAADGVPTSNPTTQTAHYPAGNYRYDDGVYDTRH